MQTTSEIREPFEQEMTALHGKLIEAVAPLTAPLHQLVRVHIDQAAPYVRGAVVLAAAVNEVDNETLKRQRIHLAAALEMLFVAHNIHKLLLTPHADDMDKSVMGSTILAGDYCFSHSAMLAAGSDSPKVVEIFAQALKRVSEGNLRYLFGESSYSDENRELFIAGVEAATVLAGLSAAHKESIISFANDLSRAIALSAKPSARALPGTDQLPSYQRNRWQLLLLSVAAPLQNGASL